MTDERGHSSGQPGYTWGELLESLVAAHGSLTAVAWIGKQVCSLGVLERGVNRLAVGLGMVPRGEVGLIFASVGATLTIAGRPVITPEIYSAAVIMVILTTLVTPPLLQRALSTGALRASGERLAHAGAKGPSQSGGKEV